MDVPANMTEEKQDSLVKRVRIIASAFEDKCLDYEETGKKGLARIQEYKDVGGSGSSTSNRIRESITELDVIKRAYNNTITIEK